MSWVSRIADAVEWRPRDVGIAWDVIEERPGTALPADLTGRLQDSAFAPDIKNTEMSGADPRGSDLSNLSGPASLHGAKVTEIQL